MMLNLLRAIFAALKARACLPQDEASPLLLHASNAEWYVMHL